LLALLWDATRCDTVHCSLRTSLSLARQCPTSTRLERQIKGQSKKRWLQSSSTPLPRDSCVSSWRGSLGAIGLAASRRTEFFVLPNKLRILTTRRSHRLHRELIYRASTYNSCFRSRLWGTLVLVQGELESLEDVPNLVLG